MFFRVKHYFFLTIFAFFLTAPFFISADFGGQQTSFFIDSSYDLQSRAQLTATLIRITPSLYFYLDDYWWNSLTAGEQQVIKASLQDLGEEFEGHIYPRITDVFGREWRPGIDNDDHITILLHPMAATTGGYINTADEYSRLQNVFSNQREMIYLNTSFLTTVLAKSYLAHEFTHLIVFNQKEKKFGKPEEIWLNEMRADYAPTLLGYDEDYQNSNLKRRVITFLQFPTDSLTEWQGRDADYGVMNMFSQYLVEQYGLEILADSLFLDKLGIASINQALVNNGFSETFADIFTDWTITNVLNDCSISSKYCYQNFYLKKLKVIPKINFLPFGVESSLALTRETKNWAGNWYKVIGGQGDLKLEFAGFPDVVFKLPYLLDVKGASKEVHFLELNSFQSGRLVIENFNADVASVIIIPSLQDKTMGFDGKEKSYPFFWSVATQLPVESEQGTEEPSVTTQAEEIKILLEKIAFLEKQLEVLKTQLREAMGQPVEEEGGQTLTFNLRQGERGEQITILQTWLAQDPALYPEALVTGYFGRLTKAAVIRFQNKYASEVLTPWGLSAGTGFVGTTTRKKLNQLYGN